MIRNGKIKTVFLFLISLCTSQAIAHHNVTSEYGSDSPLIRVEGEIVEMQWFNPHVAIFIETTGGDLGAAKLFRVNSHPVNIMTDTYGMTEDEFKVGDQVEIYGRAHIRGMPQIWMRAVSVNDGPMRSAVAHRDLQDLLSGDLGRLGIVPAPSLDGSIVNRRIDEQGVARLKELGIVDENNRVRLPTIPE